VGFSVSPVDRDGHRADTCTYQPFRCNPVDHGAVAADNRPYSLAGTIDSALPAWLRRGEFDDHHLERFAFPYKEFNVVYFRTFLEELVHSELLTRLTLFYDGLVRLDSYLKEFERRQTRKKDIVYIFMPEASSLLNFFIELMERLIATKGIEPYLTEDHQKFIENFESPKNRHRCLVQLSHLNYWHLSDLEMYAQLLPLKSECRRNLTSLTSRWAQPLTGD
jgi:hypothetical protein